MATKDAVADRVWQAFRAMCNALRTASRIKDRATAVAGAEAFMASPQHRAYVRRWRGWGLLFVGLIHAVRADVCAFLGVDPATGSALAAKKRKLTAASAKPPKLKWWLYLRNEIANAHALDGPTLHLDPNGRDCVAQLFDFALLVVNHCGDSDPDPAARRVMGELERAAWQTIELLVGLRVYCTVLEKRQLQETVELALAAVEHSAVSHSTFPTPGSGDFAVLASCIHLVLKHAPYDVHDWLPMLVPFVASWFGTLNETEHSRSPRADIAPKMVEIATDIGRSYFTFIGPLLLKHGNPLLQYIKRSFKHARQGPRVQFAAFVSLYIELFEYHADSLDLRGDLDPRRLRRDAKALHQMFLDPATLRDIPVSSYSSTGGAASSATISSAVTESSTMALEAPSVILFACAADVVFFHDRLLQRVIESAKTPDLQGGEQDEMMASPSPVKRSLESTMPMAWEQLLHQIVSVEQSEESLSASSNTQLSQVREQYASQAQHNKQAKLLQRRSVAHMLILTAVLRRHGSFYAHERIGDILTLMDHIVQTLESKDIDRRHSLALHLLYELAMLSQMHRDVRSDMFGEFWQKIWHTLLRPDLPYGSDLRVVIPRGSVSELVFTVLHCCACFRLISHTVITSTSSRLWSIYQQGSSNYSAQALNSPSLSPAPLGFLVSLLQLIQPPSDSDPSRDSTILDPDIPVRSARSSVLASIFEHMQSLLALDENKPMDASWETHFSVQGVAPALCAAGLLSLLGISPPLHFPAVMLTSEMEPALLRAFASTETVQRDCIVGPELDGFGVHFTFQEWGMAWLDGVSAFVKSPTLRDPDRFAPLVEFFRGVNGVGSSRQSHAVTKSDSEQTNGFTRLPFPRKLARCFTMESKYDPESIANVVVEAANREGKDSNTASLAYVEAAKSEIVTRLTDMLSNLSNKLGGTEVDSPKRLCYLNSILTVCLVLGCAYGQVKDAQSLNSRTELNELLNLLCIQLQKSLTVLANHFSAVTLEHARKSTMTACIVTHQLVDFHSLILVVQGGATLQSLKHPCADPFNLRIPSELRSPIRKIVAGIEASLEAMLMDDGNMGPSQTHADHSSSSAQSREYHTASSRSVPAFSSTPTHGASWDWDSHTSQSKSVSAVVTSVDDEDDLMSDTVVRSTAKPTYRVTHAPNILSLWSLRVILLLKKESGLKAVRKYGLELGFTPDFLAALASLLCGVCGCESLEVLVKIVSTIDEEVALGIRRGGSGNPATAMILDSDILSVLRRCATMHESRKLLHKEEIPELLLSTARRLIDASRKEATREVLTVVRRVEGAALEVFFRLNADIFGDFIDVAISSLLDRDIGVRFESALALQTLFYMYPEGGDQVFRDLFRVLSHCLPSSAVSPQVANADRNDESVGLQHSGTIETSVVAMTTLYVCACSSPTVVPEVLLVYMRLAISTDVPVYSRSTMLGDWLHEIALTYEYPSISRMIADHFCFLWAHHLANISGGASLLEAEEQRKQTTRSERVRGAEILSSFPAALMLGKTNINANMLPGMLSSHADVILPFAVLYDVVQATDEAGSQAFPLVDELARLLLLKPTPPSSGDDDGHTERQLSTFVEEQLITDLFALAFVLQSSSATSAATSNEEIGAHMLTLAEDRASTYALTISHLGHVVVKMARFSVWDIVGSTHPSAMETSTASAGGEQWLQAMKIMKEKYSGFDWARMNLAELLSEFHELLLRTAYFEPLASRAIECLCLFVSEIKDAISDSNSANGATLQQLLLHVLFETVRNVKRRDKNSSHKLTFVVRDICDHLMKSSTDSFGKYLNFVVQEITDILVLSSQDASVFYLDSDDKANFEWVIFAICNNMAAGLGKYMVDVEVVPTGVSACLDKLNSILSTSSGRVAKPSSTERRKSLELGVKKSPANTPGTKSCQLAIHEIEQFVQRASQVGERFYHPRTIAIADACTAGAQKRSITDTGGMGSQLQLIREHVRVLQGALQSSAKDEVVNDEKEETSMIQKMVLAKLTRTLLTLSTQFDTESARINKNGPSNISTLADTLGDIGLWDTHDFELSSGQDEQELSRLYQRHFRRGALRETKSTFQIEMYEHMLRYLSSLLFESGRCARTNSEVIHEALRSIKKVLRLDEGVKALSKCKDQELKVFLESFVQTSPSNWSVACNPIVGTGGSPTMARLSTLRALWRAHDSSTFDDWIGRLTESMAERCVDRVLQACAPLARLRGDLAVFMFPYVLWAILKNASRDAKTASVVNDCIRELMSAASQPDGRVLQLVIHSINFLRETEKALFVETNGQRSSATSSTATKKSTQTGTSSAAGQNAGPSQRGPTEAKSSVKLAYSCLVDVDLLEIAEAAIRVKMPFSAMQFVEMWLEGHHDGSLPSLSSSSLLASNPVDWEARVRAILVDAYTQDDDVDGIYGVNDGRTFGSQMVTYNREGNYVQVLPLYDVALQLDQSGSNVHALEGSLNALNQLGYENMLLQRLEALAGTGPSTPRIQEHRYELAWKNLQWESLKVGSTAFSEDLSSRSDQYMHQRTVYQSLKAVAYRDIGQLRKTTATAKVHILKSARVSLFGLESTHESLKALLYLQSLSEIEECATMIEAGNTTALGRLFETWHQRHLLQSKNVFDAIHGLLALEEVLAQVVDIPERVNTLANIHLSVSTLSRQAGRVAVVYKAHMKLEQLHKQGQLRIHDEIRWKMERAKLLWSQKETRSAIWVAKRLLSELEVHLQRGRDEPDTHLRMLHVASLTMIGKWIASQRSENSQVILHDYLQKATDIVDSMNGSELNATPTDSQHAAKAHVALAEYMAEMYQQVAARVTSREWLAGKRVAEARQKELAECLAMNEAKQHDNRAHIHALNKEVQYDYEERTKVEASVDQFLGGALRSFGKALAFSAKSELSVVFRVLSLWFSNQLKPSVNRVVHEIVETVPSYKFVPLSYQIISRVGSSLSGGSTSRTDSDSAAFFERVLSAMVVKLCEQHPHHALVQLIALKNSGDVEGKGAIEFRTNVGDEKSEGAKKYIEKLRKGPQKELLESLDALSNAYIQLALFDTRDYHKLGKKIPLADVKITTLGGNAIPFDQCLRERSRRSTGASGSSRAAMPAVLTSSITPRPDMDYSGVSRMLSFDPMFSITDSGIHRPKIIYCFGSDGGRFKQLVKGKDDIRQDLVIEQVFDTVNQFLKDDQNTRKRNLRLRTYKVVPLSPIAGVLEWVDNTIPWGSYLVSRVGKRLSAHERYHPQEWKHTECRMYLKNQPDKYTAYGTIQANFTPVFHHFFLEKFPDAAMWYKRRLAYVQSAAVTSIVGYILGIGDRHSQNILIHEETAELVHIDFGVVFDQGMALFTPETVPFRLTRDMVDGMGVSGVEGVFTRCCEATLQLLRKKSASVVTILEVFVHDPLYRWTLSPLKALKIQEEGGTAAVSTNALGSETDENSNGGVAGTNNDAAARALIRVKQKLEGYEDPNGNALSIEGQVKQLISAAQDPRNLCALFPGWAPWL